MLVLDVREPEADLVLGYGIYHEALWSAFLHIGL